jgi:hypothetical protein
MIGGQGMKSQMQIQLNPVLKIINLTLDGGSAYWQPTKNTRPAVIIFSYGGGWDHVSISFNNRCSTWEEMCRVKDMFFSEDETVVQYHPAREDYVNNHPYCLHLFRPQRESIPMPPAIMVGIKAANV